METTVTQVERLDGYAPDIGGSADKNDETHGGTDVKRPADMPTKKSADHVVRNKNQLIRAIERGGTAYIDKSFKCNIMKTIEAGGDLTIVSGFCDPERTENGGDGPTVHFDYFTDDAIQTRHSLTLYGVCFRGPEGDYFDPRERAEQNDNVDDESAYHAAGVWAMPDRDRGEFKAIGCKFYDWPHAAIKLGAKSRETTALVHRCTITDCMMETLGYGIEQFNGSLTITRSDFDRCRHAIAGFGYETETLVLSECVFGPGPHSGHVVDRHCLANNLSRISDEKAGIAGGYTRIYRCSFQSHEPGNPIQDVTVGDQEAVAIRGASTRKSYIDKCDFWHGEIPDPHGSQGDAIRQETELLDDDDVRKGWVRLDVRDNAAGGNNGPKYGAPLAEPDVEYDKLRIIGYDNRPTAYEFVVDGKVTKLRGIEGRDRIEESDGKTAISGAVWASTDTFGIETGSVIEEAYVAGTARVERNGDEVDLVGPTTRSIEKRIRALERRVQNLETM